MVWTSLGNHDPVQKWMAEWDAKNIPRAALAEAVKLITEGKVSSPAQFAANLALKQQIDFAVHSASELFELAGDIVIALNRKK